MQFSKTNVPSALVSVECSSICHVHTGLDRFPHLSIYLSIYLFLHVAPEVTNRKKEPEGEVFDEAAPSGQGLPRELACRGCAFTAGMQGLLPSRLLWHGGRCSYEAGSTPLVDVVEPGTPSGLHRATEATTLVMPSTSLPRRLFWHSRRSPQYLDSSVGSFRKQVAAGLRTYRIFVWETPVAGCIVAIIAVLLSVTPQWLWLRPNPNGVVTPTEGHVVVAVQHNSVTVPLHYIATGIIFLMFHLVVLGPLDGVDKWHSSLPICHIVLAVLQICRAARLYTSDTLAFLLSDGAATPDVTFINWIFPTACALPGLVVGLLGHFRCIGPWRAVRSRLTATLSIGIACTLWLYVRTDGKATAYPPIPSSLAGSFTSWAVLGAANLFCVSPAGRQWLNYGIVDIGSRIRSSMTATTV